MLKKTLFIYSTHTHNLTQTRKSLSLLLNIHALQTTFFLCVPSILFANIFFFCWSLLLLTIARKKISMSRICVVFFSYFLFVVVLSSLPKRCAHYDDSLSLYLCETPFMYFIISHFLYVFFFLYF